MLKSKIASKIKNYWLKNQEFRVVFYSCSEPDFKLQRTHGCFKLQRTYERTHGCFDFLDKTREKFSDLSYNYYIGYNLDIIWLFMNGFFIPNRSVPEYDQQLIMFNEIGKEIGLNGEIWKLLEWAVMRVETDKEKIPTKTTFYEFKSHYLEFKDKFKSNLSQLDFAYFYDGLSGYGETDLNLSKYEHQLLFLAGQDIRHPGIISAVQKIMKYNFKYSEKYF